MRDWLNLLLRDAGVVELRHHDGDRWRSGLFDTVVPLVDAITERVGNGNLYTSVNKPGADVKATNAMGTRALADADMRTHTRLLIDLDPVRPRGMPSTDDEVDEACRARNRVTAALGAMGWPAPAIAVSGNGAHAIYRACLPVADDISEMLSLVYRGLRADFSTKAVEFDATVRNPARIWRCYGTTNRKGLATEERPHRVAFVSVPQKWAPVSPRLVEQLANSYARRLRPTLVATVAPVRAPITGRGDFKTLDAPAWFGAHGLYRRHLGQGKHAVVCPWDGEHSIEAGPGDTSTVIWEATPTTWPSFHCSHSHCTGRDIRAVMEVLGDADTYCGRAWEPHKETTP